jgi:uncharacterized lipoprotein YddW (UPF0748 family)
VAAGVFSLAAGAIRADNRDMMRRLLAHLVLSLLVLGLAFAGPVLAARPDAARREQLRDGRAIWVKRDQLTTPARIVRTVDEAAEAGITVMFVQVRGRGDAWYESDLVPTADLVAGKTFDDGTPFDPLDVLLRRAHARGIEVHAWVNCFLIWSGPGDPGSRDHVMWRHPDWVAIDDRGRPLSAYTPKEMEHARIEGAFLASANPAVRRHLVDVAVEIATRYPVDGIHLDYIRNALVDTGYDRVTRAAFLAEKGIDPWKLRKGKEGLVDRFGAEGLESLEAEWKSWRADQVTRLVREMRVELNALPRPVVLSAAVFPNCRSAPRDVGQDWMAWAKEGLVDLVVPMMYSPKTNVVVDQLLLAQRELPLDVVMYCGLAVYNQPLQTVVQTARRVQASGAEGVCFFPYDTLAEKPGTLQRLSAACFGATGPDGARPKTATAR